MTKRRWIYVSSIVLMLFLAAIGKKHTVLVDANVQKLLFNGKSWSCKEKQAEGDRKTYYIFTGEDGLKFTSVDTERTNDIFDPNKAADGDSIGQGHVTVTESGFDLIEERSGIAHLDARALPPLMGLSYKWVGRYLFIDSESHGVYRFQISDIGEGVFHATSHGFLKNYDKGEAKELGDGKGFENECSILDTPEKADPHPSATPQSNAAHSSTVFFQEYETRHPDDLAKDPAVSAWINTAFPGQLDHILRNLAVSENLQKRGEWLIGFGCAKQLCGSEEAVIAVNERSKDSVIGMLSNGKRPARYTVDRSLLPKEVLDWMDKNAASIPSPTPQLSNTIGAVDREVASEPQSPQDADEGPSFNCAEASTFIEKEICSDHILSKLDRALAQNYTWMGAADIGTGAKQALIGSHKLWLATRNRCTDKECLSSIYRKRLDEICDIPVLSGVYPNCIGSNSIP